MITSWAVPDKVEDLYPNKAVELEKSRRILIDQFLKKKFELINPSMIEYADNITFSGKSLSEDTFKVSDPLSGRMLGITPDLTIQTARIDNYLAKTVSEVKKYCYCGSVLKAKKEQFTQSREELQVGVEIYGNEKVEADITVVSTLINSLKLLKIKDILLSFNDITIYTEFLKSLALSAHDSKQLRSFFAKKDLVSIKNLLGKNINSDKISKIELFMDMFGNDKSFKKIQEFFVGNRVILDRLKNLKKIMNALPSSVKIIIDLSDVDFYEYHSGFIFSAYSSKYTSPIAKGGRFENLTTNFGKKRPAVGFTFDLRSLLFVG
jgi:ATP phosphoribosyltransferase regulatory subunit